MKNQNKPNDVVEVKNQKQINEDDLSIESEDAPSHINKVLIVICILILALALFGLGKLFISKYKISTYHVIDLAEISRHYQDQARQKGMGEGVTNEQQAQALTTLQNQMSALKTVTEDYAKNCNCAVFVKSAIVAAPNDQVVDISNEVVNVINQMTMQAAFTTQKPSVEQNQALQNPLASPAQVQ